MGQIRTGLRSTSKRHGITVIHLPQSYYTHRLKVCFVLMSSISTLEQPSATPHYADATLGTDPSAAAFQSTGIHALGTALTTVLDALKEEQYKRSRLLSRWACEGCLAGELHVLHGPREAPAPPELAAGAFTACQEHAGTLAKACPTARWECGHSLARHPHCPPGTKRGGADRGSSA